MQAIKKKCENRTKELKQLYECVSEILLFRKCKCYIKTSKKFQAKIVTRTPNKNKFHVFNTPQFVYTAFVIQNKLKYSVLRIPFHRFLFRRIPYHFILPNSNTISFRLISHFEDMHFVENYFRIPISLNSHSD